MKHTFISHPERVNPGLLKFIDNDTPKCQGRSEYQLCTFSRIECHKSCYASESMSCSVYRMLMQMKSHYNHLEGVVKR